MIYANTIEDTLEHWFIQEVVAHEAALMRYLFRIWPNRGEVHDLRQEIYVRVFEAASRDRPYSPKSFLFATARHLLADRVRRERIVSIEARGDFESLSILVDQISPERRTCASQELGHLARVFDQLPPRCREVMWMRKVEELPQREVAKRLGINENAVEKQVSRGMRLLAEGLFGKVSRSGLRNRAGSGAGES